MTSFRIVMAGIYTYLGAAIASILWSQWGQYRYGLEIFRDSHLLAYVGIALMVIGVAYGIKSWHDLRKNKV